MGWFFRKSINFGPIRLNFSKSGIGMSAGVRGARVSTGPRGTYISMGLDGFYYRQKLQTDKAESTRSTSPIEGSPSKWSDTAIEVPQGRILESIKPPKKNLLPTLVVHLCYLALTLGTIIYIAWYGLNRLPHTLEGRNQTAWMLFTVPLIVWVTGVVVHYLIIRATSVSQLHPLYYELDQKSAARFATIRKACESLAQSQRVWTLASPPGGSYLMYGASQAWVGQQQPPLISTNVEVWAIAIGNWRMFFLPDSIYIFQNNSYSTLPYEKLRFSYGERRAFEYSGLPSDAQIVDKTWQHTRKDGLPDLRYKYNPMIPIVLYGLVNIESSVGWNMVLQTSNVDAARQFVYQLTSVLPGARKQEYQKTRDYKRKNEYRERKSSTYGKTTSTSKSPYEVLGVAPGASLEEITEAYRKQARMNHPDKVANLAPEFRELAEHRMKEINAAYEELKERFK